MDRLLRGEKQLEINEEIKKIDELFKKSYDLSSNFILFPVRHHSPVCSFHLEKVIEEYQPEAILIEGPKNAGHLIEYAVSDKTKTPFCIYLSYDDKSGKINEEKGKYRAFYPFLDYSPELIALRKGAEKEIHCEFIDLSYGEKLLNTPNPEQKNIENYEDDREFLQSSYYKMLVEKMGCKNFNELWEMLFEIEGFHTETEIFLKSLFYYCYYSRENTPQDELIYHGDIIREYYMAENIREAMKKYKKVLVVTGGIHTIELVNLITAEKLPSFKIESIKEEDSPSYLMPYSFEESDRNSGYESGMVFPFFYQKVWENINKNRKKPFEESVLRFIINTAGAVRKKQPLSIADEMQSYYMARGLGELREKKECGVFELIDGVKAAFVKGEINSYHQPALKNLHRLLTGMEMGSIDPDCGVPPLVNDFFVKCKKFKIATTVSMKKETKLDVYNNESHREKSRFFHQMNFLGTDFCHYIRGQDSNTGKGRILLRETWEYRFFPGVQVALITNSAYGGTVEEACLSLIIKGISAEHSNARELSDKLLQANRMGLNSVYGVIFEKLMDIIGNDMDFLSVSDCFKNLCEVKTYNTSFTGIDIPMLDKVIELNLNRMLTLIYTIINSKKEDEDNICDGIKFLYTYFIDSLNREEEEAFIQSMFSIYEDNNANTALSGAGSAVLFKKGRITLEEAMTKFNSYLNGSDISKKMSASFLKGFFKIAKDIVFVDDRMLHSLDEILKDTDGDLFLEILPDLRFAFTYFLPFETDKIAKQVSSFYDISGEALLYGDIFDQKQMEKAADIDRYCAEKLDEWLLMKGEEDGR